MKKNNKLNQDWLSAIDDALNDLTGNDNWGLSQKYVKSRSKRINSFRNSLKHDLDKNKPK